MYHVLRFKKDASGQRERLTMQFYFKLRGFYVFFFTLADESQKLDRKYTWFVVKKTQS